MAEDNGRNAEIAEIQLEEVEIQITGAEDVQRSLDAGMNGHLSKPIVMDELVKTIARNLNR